MKKKYICISIILSAALLISTCVRADNTLDGFVFDDGGTTQNTEENKSGNTYTIDGLDGFIFEGEPPEKKPPKEIVPDTSTDITNEYRQEYVLLKELGLVNEKDGTNIDAPYTRKQFAKLITLLMNLTQSDKCSFSDVSTDDVYYPYIAAVCDKDIFPGQTAENFYPDNCLKFAQMIKALINALGCKSYAEALGSYPNGYLDAARKTDIIKNISLSADTDVTFKDVIRVVYNTLNAGIFELKLDSGTPTVEKSDETLLLKRYHIMKISGTLNEVYGSNIYGASYCENNEIAIDRQIYKFDSPDRSFLGKNVVAFVSSEDESKMICCVEDEKRKSEVITVQSEDLNGISNMHVNYSENGKNKSFLISKDANVMYNGAYMSSAAAYTDFVPTSGYITAIDNDNDNKYDVIMIWDFRYYPVSAANESLGRIYFKNAMKYDGNEYINLDKDDEDYLTFIERGGVSIGLSDINENDVVSIAVSRSKYGKTIKTVYASSESTDGTVTSMGEDTVTIGDKTYTLAYGYAGASLENIEAGAEGKFFMNHRGQILFFEASVNNDLNYGFLTNAYFDDKGSEPEERLKILTVLGKWEMPELSSKPKVHITTALSTEDVKKYNKSEYAALKEYLDTRIGISGVLIKYKMLNELVSDIYFSDDLSKTDGYPGLDKKEFSLDYSVSGDSDTIRLYNGTLGAKMFADSKTKVMIVPSDLSQGVNTKQYKVGNINLFETPSDIYLKNVKFYDVDEDRNVSVIVQFVDKVDTSKIKSDAAIAIVNGCLFGTDDDGETIYMLDCLKDGNETKLALSSDYKDLIITDTTDNWYRENISFSSLKAGDVIQYETNTAGEVESFRLLLRVGDIYNEKWDKAGQVPANNKMANIHTAYGVVREKQQDCIIVNCNTEENPSYDKAYKLINTSIYAIDMKDERKPRAKKIKAKEIGVRDKVFVYSWWNMAKIVLVVRD